MSLYRKYRPQSFAHLVGQDHIKETLMNELKHGHLTHAYLFAGPRGTGKTSTARLIAKGLNCVSLDERGEPCETCEFCLSISEGTLIDVIEIDAASNRGIDEIRDLREKIKFAPTRAKNKIYIIDEVHMLTKEAFNALLKTLEEPPENVYFILCTTEVHKIPETIISRCQRFDFRRIEIKTIMTRLSYIAQTEGISAEDAAIELIARNVQGGLRDAISLFEQMVFNGKVEAAHIKEHLGIAGHETVSNFVNAVSEKDAAKAINIIRSVNNEGYDLASFHREILEFLREKLFEAVLKEKPEEIPELLRIIELFIDARNMLKYSPIPELPLEIACMKICVQPGAAVKIPDSAQQNIGREEPKTVFFKKIMEEKKGKTQAATEEETETAKHIKESMESKSWDLETASTNWPRLLEELKPPSLRRSMAEARLTDLSDDGVTLSFSSKFHMEKVNMSENRAKLEAVFAKLFGRKPKIKLVHEAPALAEAQIAETSKESQNFKESKVEDLARKALDIFGGEEVE